MSEPKSKRRKISKSYDNIVKDLERDFGVKFERDISIVWEWAVKEHAKAPLKSLSKLLKIELCGPFRYLNDEKENAHEKRSDTDKVEAVRDAAELHMLDREWQCPPEMQPCVCSDTSLYGYWRDSPSDVPVFIVKKTRESGTLTPVATDILHLIRVLCKQEKARLPESLFKLTESYTSPDTLKQRENKRRKSVVAKTFNKVGIVVPLHDNEVGYRPLTISYSELDDVLRRSCETEDDEKKDRILAPFDECMNYIQFANDECDYGMGFEMGMCVFSHSTSRHFMGTIESLLPLAYKLLEKPLFSEIMKKICEKEEDAKKIE